MHSTLLKCRCSSDCQSSRFTIGRWGVQDFSPALIHSHGFIRYLLKITELYRTNSSVEVEYYFFLAKISSVELYFFWFFVIVKCKSRQLNLRDHSADGNRNVAPIFDRIIYPKHVRVSLRIDTPTLCCGSEVPHSLCDVP